MRRGTGWIAADRWQTAGTARDSRLREEDSLWDLQMPGHAPTATPRTKPPDPVIIGNVAQAHVY